MSMIPSLGRVLCPSTQARITTHRIQPQKEKADCQKTVPHPREAKQKAQRKVARLIGWMTLLQSDITTLIPLTNTVPFLTTATDGMETVCFKKTLKDTKTPMKLNGREVFTVSTEKTHLV